MTTVVTKLFAIAVAAFGLAAAAMTAYLRLLRPGGPLWVAVVLGLSYALCGWGVEQGTYMTAWLNGMVAFPVLALLGEWMVTRRSPTSTPACRRCRFSKR